MATKQTWLRDESRSLWPCDWPKCEEYAKNKCINRDSTISNSLNFVERRNLEREKILIEFAKMNEMLFHSVDSFVLSFSSHHTHSAEILFCFPILIKSLRHQIVVFPKTNTRMEKGRTAINLMETNFFILLFVVCSFAFCITFIRCDLALRYHWPNSLTVWVKLRKF